MAALHLTQPTVSAQVHELQSALNTSLVEPAGRGIRTTEAARLLREAALEIFARWQRFEEDLQALHGLQRGLLPIAGVTTTEYFITQWLRRYTDSHPGIEIELAVDNRDAVVRRLQQEATELAVMMMPPDDLPLQRVPLMRNPLVLIGPRGPPVGTCARRWAATRPSSTRWPRAWGSPCCRATRWPKTRRRRVWPCCR